MKKDRSLIIKLSILKIIKNQNNLKSFIITVLCILVEVDERDQEKEKEMDGMVKRKSGHWYLLYMFHESQTYGYILYRTNISDGDNLTFTDFPRDRIEVWPC